MRGRNKHWKISQCSLIFLLWRLLGCFLVIYFRSLVHHATKREERVHLSRPAIARELEEIEEENFHLPQPRGRRSPHAFKRRGPRKTPSAVDQFLDEYSDLRNFFFPDHGTAIDPSRDDDDSLYYHPGRLWLDADGKPIQAHGGGILFNEKTETFCWYGENKDGPTYHAHEKAAARLQWDINLSETGSTSLDVSPLAISRPPSFAINKAMAVPVKSGGNRRLLSHGFPKWVGAGDRRLLQSSGVKADLVVAKDGSGNYRTISEAVAAAGKLRKGTSRYVIYVKGGAYKENVEIKLKNIMMVGDGIDKTVVTGSRNVQDGSTAFRSAVTGEGFIARDMTFENTAGPQKHQAVALRSGSDLSVFYRCSFEGYQDTLYVYSQRQFYRNCDVYGTVDFIFGDAAAVLQNCNIYVRKPMSNQKNTVTAQGRSDPNENTGIVIHNSVVTAASDLRPVQGSFRTYLGRPWKEHSRTVFMKTRLDGLIAPAGWFEWIGNFALNTLYYGVYMNTGAGAGTGGRVKWKGHIINSAPITLHP